MTQTADFLVNVVLFLVAAYFLVAVVGCSALFAMIIFGGKRAGALENGDGGGN